MPETPPDHSHDFDGSDGAPLPGEIDPDMLAEARRVGHTLQPGRMENTFDITDPDGTLKRGNLDRKRTLEYLAAQPKVN